MQDGLKSVVNFEKSAAYGPRTFPRRSKPHRVARELQSDGAIRPATRQGALGLVLSASPLFDPNVVADSVWALGRAMSGKIV